MKTERKIDMDNIENISGCLDIPDKVPYLGGEEKYFLGGGLAGAGGDTDGTWDFLIRPAYTSPNFLKSEVVHIIIDGEQKCLRMKFHRGRRTGFFFGFMETDGLTVRVVDFAAVGEPWVARLVCIENGIGGKTREVGVIAEIEPEEGAQAAVTDGSAVVIKQDTSVQNFGGGNTNWAERSALITFNVPCIASLINTGLYSIRTSGHKLSAGKIFVTALYHHLYFNEACDEIKYVHAIKAAHPAADYRKSLKEWEDWFLKNYKLQVFDKRACDIIEAVLVMTRMQQSADGGFIAGTRAYPLSYLRDSHGASRGLLAAGFCDEVKRVIQWVHHKFEVFGYIPNAAEMGADFKTMDLGGPANIASETPAYYLLMIRNYYEKTGDLEFLKSIEHSMKYAVEIQLEYAKEAGWKLPFNGDETEQYVPFEDGQIYGGFPALPGFDIDSWSMPSLAACIASLEFYSKYLYKKGDAAEARLLEEKLGLLVASLDENFWMEDAGMHCWCRYADGRFPEYAVTNFSLLPLWLGTRLNYGREIQDAARMIGYIKESGFLPIAPGAVQGFCGHTLGLLLYDLVRMKHEKAAVVYDTIVNGGISGCFGTVSEFYGPEGTPNTHNMRIFESGINLEALIVYCNAYKKEVER